VQDIVVGTLGQWLVKPALGVLLATTVVPLLGLPPAVGTGLILVRHSALDQASRSPRLSTHMRHAGGEPPPGLKGRPPCCGLARP